MKTGFAKSGFFSVNTVLCQLLSVGVWLSLWTACTSEVQKQAQAADSLSNDTQIAPSSPRLEWHKTVNLPEVTYYLCDTTRPVWILFFDPQGKGNFPVEAYKNLAEKYKINLMGSNLSKNGNSMEFGEEIALNAIRKLVSDFPGPNKAIYFSGFSGGAKVALSSGMVFTEVKGVAYAGAPFLADQVSKPVLGFAGSKDMNYPDLLNFNQAIPATVPHHLIEWKGKHEWPDTNTFERTFQWIAGVESLPGFQFRAITEKGEALSRSSVPAVEKVNYLGYVDFVAKQTGQENPLLSSLTRLRKSPEYQSQIKEQNQTLAKELSLKEMYNQAFIDKDVAWWNAEIQKVRQQNSPMNQRLLGHFSLAAYSHSVNLLTMNRLELAEKCLDIYRLADPDNPEHAYLRAVLAGKSEKYDQVVPALEEAVNLGFHDKKRLMEQSEFQPVQDQAAFRQVADRL